MEAGNVEVALYDYIVALIRVWDWKQKFQFTVQTVDVWHASGTIVSAHADIHNILLGCSSAGHDHGNDHL